MKRRHDIDIPSEPRAEGLTRRGLLAAAPAAVAVVAGSGCIGSFALTNKMLDWNMSIGNKWVNWIVFVLLMIIGVYPIVWGLVDLFVINSIEFWTGSTPFSAKPTPDGGRVVTERTSDPKVARLTHENADGELLTEMYIERVSDEHFRLMDAQGRVLMSVEGRDDATLRDGKGRRVARLNARQMRQVAKAMEQGASVAETAWTELGANDEQGQLLALADDVHGYVRI